MAKRFSFSPRLRRIKIKNKNTTNLTKGGDSNALARFSIILAREVSYDNSPDRTVLGKHVFSPSQRGNGPLSSRLSRVGQLSLAILLILLLAQACSSMASPKVLFGL